MFSNEDFARFLRQLAAAALFTTMAALGLVLLVDPYRIYRWLDVPGFNQIKPQPERYQEQIKLVNARASKANAFILGNSRAEIGFNPDYAGFASAGLSAYNLALSGTRISVARRELEFLKNAGVKPRFVLLGIDFLDYPVTPSDPVVPQPNDTSKPTHDVGGLKWQFDALFSLTSLADTIKTLQIQQDSEAQTISARGLNPFWEYKKYVRQEGYYPIFQQRALEYAKVFLHKPHGLKLNQSGSSAELEGLRAVLSLLATESTESHLVIYPYHAQILAMFEEAGLWPVFEQWKDLLVAEIDAVKAHHPAAHITLWDFSGYGDSQCETIPGKNDKTSATQWYWEAGHFKQTYGDQILARVLKEPRRAVEPIGMALNAGNLRENGIRIQQQRAVCMAAYPALFQQVDALMQAERDKH